MIKELEELEFYKDGEQMFKRNSAYQLYCVFKNLKKRGEYVLGERDCHGNTPLHYTVQFSYALVTKLLMDGEEGCLFMQNNDSQCPFEYAFASAKNTVGRWAKFPIPNRELFHRDFLIYLIEKKQLGLISAYFCALSPKFSLSAPLFEGCTALHHAASTVDPKVIRFFAITHGCSFEAENSFGERPMYVFRNAAHMKGVHESVVEEVEKVEEEWNALQRAKSENLHLGKRKTGMSEFQPRRSARIRNRVHVST